MKHFKSGLVRAGIYLAEDPQRARLLILGLAALLALALTLAGLQAPAVLLAGPADGGNGGTS